MFDKKKWETLLEAVKTNDAAQVKAAAADLKLAKEEKYYDACVTAIDSGADKALAALLEAGGGFDFSKRITSGGYSSSGSRERGENNELARKLVGKAYASPAGSDLLPVLYYQNEKGGHYNSLYMINFLNKSAPETLLKACLEKNPATNFGPCIAVTGVHSTDKLKFILEFSDAKRDATALANALASVAACGDIEKAALLLEKEANANFDNGAALIAAATGGLEMVDFLLPHIALKYYGENIITQLHNNGTDPAILESIEAAMQQAPQKGVAAPAAMPPSEERFQPLDEDTLAEVKRMPDGSILTTLFNFSSKQQEKYTKNEAGDISHAKPVNFSDLDDGVVEAMRAKLDTLIKPQTTPAAANDGYKALRSFI